MSKNQMSIEEMVSPDINKNKDAEVLARIVNMREPLHELEGELEATGRVPMGAKELLYDMRSIEKDVCDAGVFSVYYADLARAYMLNLQMVEAHECGHSALICNRYTEDAVGQATALQLLSELAYYMGDFEMSVHFMDEQKQHHPLVPDQARVYDRIRKAIDDGKSPQPQIKIEKEMPPVQSLAELLEREQVEVAARRIRRASGMSLKKARAEAAHLSSGVLNSMFPKPDEEDDAINISDEMWHDDERGLTDKFTGFYDEDGEEIYEGSVVATDSIVGRMAEHKGQWAIINPGVSFYIDQDWCDQMRQLNTPEWQNQCATYKEWLHDGGSMVGGLEPLKAGDDIPQLLSESEKRFEEMYCR